MEEKGYVHEVSPDSLNWVRTWNDISYIISRWAHFKYTKDVLKKFPNLKAILLAQIGNDKKSIYSVGRL